MYTQMMMKKNILILSALLLIFLACSKKGDVSPLHGGNKEAFIISVEIKDKNNANVIVESVIDTAKLTVSVLVKEGSDIEKLKFYALISDGATMKPATGTVADFSIPVKFAVTSENGKLTNDWFIIVREERPNDAMITSVDDMTNKEDVSVLASSEIDEENRTVAILVKEETDLKNLKLHASISGGASITPEMDVLTDFSNPVEYTITSKNRQSVHTWLVTVVVKEFIDDDSGFDYDLDPTEWKLNTAKSDHFDNWDETTWIASQASSGNFDYDADNILVANGKLRIKVDTQGERYTAGKVKSAVEIGKNSYVKIRAKTVNNKASVNSSIVLESLNAGITLTKTSAGNPAALISALRGESSVLDTKTTKTGANLSNDYHVYGLERRNEYLRFFFDGEVIWEFETAQYPDLSKQLLNLMIGIDPIADTKPNGTEMPGYLLIDYMEVYDAVNTVETAPIYGNNLVINPGFESEQGDNAPEGWTVTSSSGETEVWTFRDYHGYQNSESRFHFGKVSDPTTFDYSISQRMDNLPNGLYRLEVWAYMVEGKSPLDPMPRLFAKGYGNNEKETIIDQEGLDFEQESWKKYVIDNIYVSNGSCEIGVQAISNSNGLYRLFIDDFSFVKVDY